MKKVILTSRQNMISLFGERAKPVSFLSLVLYLLFVFCAPAFAQPVSPDDVVEIKERLVDDASSIGMPVGGFIVTPGVSVGGTYDDNIFRTRNNRLSDYLTEVKPALAVQSNWSRHALYIGGNADMGTYANQSRDDFADLGAVVSGQYDIAPETFLTAALMHERWHSGNATDADVTNATQRNFTTTTEQLGFTRELSYIRLKMVGENKDTNLLSGDEVLVSGDLTKVGGQSLQTTLSYEFVPKNSFFVSNKMERAKYTQNQTVDRTVNGVDFRGGFNIDSLDVLKGSLFGGFLRETYDNPGGHDQNPYVGSTLAWAISPLSRLSLKWDRSFRTTTETGTVGVVTTTRMAELSHALLSQLEVKIRAGVDDYDYVGRASNLAHENRLYYAGAGLVYKLNDHLALLPSYDYRARNSSVESEKFKENRAMISLTFMY